MKSSKVFALLSIRKGFRTATPEANACELPAITVNYRKNATCDFIKNVNMRAFRERNSGENTYGIR